MKTIISNDITIYEPIPAILNWCEQHLVLNNPDYVSLKRMGKEDLIKWKHVPEKICVYSYARNALKLPYGCLYALWQWISTDEYETRFNNAGNISFKYDKAQGIDEFFDYQENAIKYMMFAKGGLLNAPCGGGKTFMGMELIRRIGKKALWICHTSDLLRQAKDDLLALYPNAKIGLTTEGKVDIGEDITISTVQTLCNVDPSLYRDKFDVVIIDECMPCNTQILTKNGYKLLQNISNGDIVYSYGMDGKISLQPVINIFKHIPSDLYVIKLENNENIVCTGNHPIYTKNGYKPAKEIDSNDYLLQMVQKGIRHSNSKQINKTQYSKKRLWVLLPRMRETGFYRTTQTISNRRNASKISRKYDKTKQNCFARTKNRETFISGTYRKNSQQFKSDGIYFFNSRREWKRNSRSSVKFIQCSKTKGPKLLFRISNSYQRKTPFGISDLLQNRYSNTRFYDRNRSRWFKSREFESTGKGQEKREFIKWVRVDYNQVQEQTSDGTFGGLCPDGFVYNIEVAVNNNYFANKYLVHNCQHCVSAPSKMKMFGKVMSTIPARYKFGLTATPIRADGMTNAMYAYIGLDIDGKFSPTYKVDRKQVKTMEAEHIPVELNSGYNDPLSLMKIYDSSGMLDYNALINTLCEDDERTDKILNKVIECVKEGRKQIVLSLRVEHCEHMVELLQKRGVNAVLCVGKVSAKKRDEILKQKVDWDVLVATYSLLKEGISIKELDTLHLTSPAKEKGLIVQCAGRIERYLEGKKQPLIFDYVDMDIPYCVNAYKKRKTALRKRF